MRNVEKIYLWVEKYRPEKLDDMVLPDDYRKIFTRFINEHEIPHLLLYGPPGSGKTAISRILIDNVIKDKVDCLEIAGSADTSVDVVRNIIIDFLKAPSFGGGKVKIVFIDECDYMSPNALAALRNVTQLYHQNGRFIFTCNYLYKIPKPLQSRCQAFEFKKSTKEYIQNYCEDILILEDIKFNKIDVEKVISANYPDIRKIINTIQSRCTDNELQIKGNDIESKEKLFRSFITEMFAGIEQDKGNIISTAVQKMLKFLSNNDLDYTGLYQDMFFDDNIPVWAKIIVNQYSNTQLTAMIPPMHLMAMVYAIIKAGKQLRDMRK